FRQCHCQPISRRSDFDSVGIWLHDHHAFGCNPSRSHDSFRTGQRTLHLLPTSQSASNFLFRSRSVCRRVVACLFHLDSSVFKMEERKPGKENSAGGGGNPGSVYSLADRNNSCGCGSISASFTVVGRTCTGRKRSLSANLVLVFRTSVG